jgi:Protein of unknown function DUF45
MAPLVQVRFAAGSHPKTPHMNHSAKFWATVARLTADTASAEAWLKAHGSGLLRFGQS